MSETPEGAPFEAWNMSTALALTKPQMELEDVSAGQGNVCTTGDRRQQSGTRDAGAGQSNLTGAPPFRGRGRTMPRVHLLGEHLLAARLVLPDVQHVLQPPDLPLIPARELQDPKLTCWQSRGRMGGTNQP